MIAVITAVTQQKPILFVTPAAHEAEVQVNLQHRDAEIKRIVMEIYKNNIKILKSKARELRNLDSQS